MISNVGEAVVPICINFFMRIKDILRVKDNVQLSKQAVNFLAVEFFQERRPQQTVIVLARRAATHFYNHGVIIVDDFVAWCDLSQHP